MDLGFLGEKNYGPVSAGIGFRQGTADGTSIADLHVRNTCGAVMKNRNPSSRDGIFDLSVSSERPKMQRPALFLDIGGVRHEVQVDQVTGIREAQLHQRNQALTTGEQLGIVSQLGEHGRRFLSATPLGDSERVEGTSLLQVFQCCSVDSLRVRLIRLR